MIRLLKVNLEIGARNQLDAWQKDLNGVSTYPSRVEKGKALFKARNIKGNETFQRVRTALRQMCGGSVRCAYCEHSTPDEVEHIWPKDLYPARVFDWFNYLYACGICNGRKLNHWCVSDASGASREFKRSRAERDAGNYGPPPDGAPLFIDPRDEDPLRFLCVDLIDTFWVLPRRGLSDRDEERATWTITKLELNLREDLVDARANHYLAYIDRLRQHIAERDHGASHDELTPRIEGIRRMDHPMVWREMQRSRATLPSVGLLFAQAPEALAW